MAKQEKKLGRALATMEKRIGRAFAVMDKKSVKMLNYRQVIRHPSYLDDWTK